MALTFTQIQNDAIYRFGGSASDLSSYPNIGTWINQKYHEINASQPWKWTEKTIDFTVSQGVQSYTLTTIDANYRKIVDLRDITTGYGRKLQNIPVEQLDRYRPIQTDTSSQGAPMSYYIWNGSLYLYDVPDQTYTLEMRYYANDNDLVNGTDTPNLPSTGIELLCIYGYAMILATNFMYDQYNRQMQEFANVYNTLVQAEITDNEDELQEVDPREPTYDTPM